MQALGLIETKGLLAAVEAADTMLKSADVSIIDKNYVGGGLVTIIISGDVAAVKASIEAGVVAITKLDQNLLVSDHVIPSPHDELESIIESNINDKGSENSLYGKGIQNNDKKEDSKEKIDNQQHFQNNTNIEEDIEKQVNDESQEQYLQNEEDINKEKNIKEIEENSDETKDVYVELDKLNKLNLKDVHKEDIDRLIMKNGIEKTLVILDKLKVVKLRNLAREYDDFVIKGRTISKASKSTLITKFKLYYEKN